MAYTDLITYETLQDVTFDGEALVDGTANQAEVEGVIAEESSRIADWLHTPLIAQSFEQVIRQDEWDENDAYSTGPYEAYLQHTPVVEVLTDDYSARRDQFVASDSREAVVIDYVAGYLRPDQALSDLQAVVPDATVTPGVLPGQIRSACARLVAYRLLEAKDSLQGRQQVDQSIGQQGNIVTSMQTGYVQRILDDLTRYRRRT